MSSTHWHHHTEAVTPQIPSLTKNDGLMQQKYTLKLQTIVGCLNCLSSLTRPDSYSNLTLNQILYISNQMILVLWNITWRFETKLFYFETQNLNFKPQLHRVYCNFSVNWKVCTKIDISLHQYFCPITLSTGTCFHTCFINPSKIYLTIFL